MISSVTSAIGEHCCAMHLPFSTPNDIVLCLKYGSNQALNWSPQDQSQNKRIRLNRAEPQG